MCVYIISLELASVRGSKFALIVAREWVAFKELSHNKKCCRGNQGSFRVLQFFMPWMLVYKTILVSEAYTNKRKLLDSSLINADKLSIMTEVDILWAVFLFVLFSLFLLFI